MTATAAPPRSMRLLLAEDEWLIVERIESALEGTRYAVTAKAPSVSTVMQTLDAQTFDAAILDGNLDGERTDTVAERLRGAGTPFLMLTAYCENDRIFPARVPLLVKPFAAEALLEALDNLIRGTDLRQTRKTDY